MAIDITELQQKLSEMIASSNALTAEHRELLKVYKGLIDVAVSGQLGDLAVFNTLSAAPVGNVNTLRQAIGVQNVAGRGVASPTPNADLMAVGNQGFAGPGITLINFDEAPALSRLVAGAGSSATGKIPNNAAFWVGLELYRSGGRGARLLLDSRGMYLRGWTNGQESMDLSFFHDENVVGPVSRNGAKQTGALFERDGNSDGSWLKLPGGRMVCQTGGSFTALESTNINVVWDFPQEFFVSANDRLVAAREIHISLKIDGGAYNGNLSVGGHTLKEWRARCLNNSDAGKRVNVTFQITGTTGSDRTGHYTLVAEGLWHE